MKSKLHCLFIALGLFACVQQAAAQGAQFFRISGPTATKITAFRPDGTLIWTNAPTNATFTVQTATSLVGDANWVDYVQIPITNSVNTNQLIDPNPPAGMTLIPAGMFTIGDTLDGIATASPTNVTVSAFYMDINLVTYSLWQTVYTYATGHGYAFDNVGYGKAGNHPVQNVDWFDAVKWCNARSQQVGLTPVYYTDAGLTQLYTNQGDVYANWTNNGYRLPTEAEWEKAARGGLSGLRFPWSDTISESQANYAANPDNLNYGVNYGGYDLGPYDGYNTNFDTGGYPMTYTSPVGYFAPNGYGLYDMAGNVTEWCWDWATITLPPTTGSAYLGGTDPHGSAGNQLGVRVMRGGNWNSSAEYLRCAYSDSGNPNASTHYQGFRCVRGH